MEGLGVRNKQSLLFRGYLSIRSQCIDESDTESENLLITYGVPQGSLLDPTLFLIYTYDGLCHFQIPNGRVIAIADDTALILQAKFWE